MMISRRLAHLLNRRCINSNSLSMQQYAQRQGTFRTFSQPQTQQDAMEPANNDQYTNNEEISPFTRSFNRTISPFGSRALAASATEIDHKAGINPFPEEVAQDYTLHTLFVGASESPFSSEITLILHADLNPEEVEIKPDGALYLPESRYRKLLCRAFGPGGWALLPRGASSISNNVLSREYALFCNGRFVSQARGHANIQGFSNPAMASEVVRSNALMRVCKDLGVGNELWDPAYVANWKATYAIRRTENGRVRWYKKDQLSLSGPV